MRTQSTMPGGRSGYGSKERELGAKLLRGLPGDLSPMYIHIYIFKHIHIHIYVYMTIYIIRCDLGDRDEFCQGLGVKVSVFSILFQKQQVIRP